MSSQPVGKTGRKVTAVGKPYTFRSKRKKKLELMEQARRAGWKGRTYHSAKKFERLVDYGDRAWDRVKAEMATGVEPVAIGTRIHKRVRKFFAKRWGKR